METLTLSSTGLTEIISREGLIDGFYNDSKELCTFGIGHLVHSADKEWGCFLLAATKSNDAWKNKLLTDPRTRAEYLARSAVTWPDWSNLKSKAVELGTVQLGQAKFGKDAAAMNEGEKSLAKALCEQAVTVEVDLIAKVPRDLFQSKIAAYESAVNQTITAPLTQDEFDALVSFTYNIGTVGFSKSTVARKINEKKYRAGESVADRESAIKAIEDAFLMWNQPAEIISRRKGEADSFLKGAREDLAQLRLRTKK